MPDTVISEFARLPEQFPGMEAVPSSGVYLMGCRSFEQFCSTLRGLIDSEAFCPFCEEESTRRGRIPIHQTMGWRLLENEFPNQSTSKMLLIVPTRHATSLAHLSDIDWEQIGELLAHCHNRLGIESGGILARFGDPHLHAGTIEHFHMNVIVPVSGVEYRAPLAKALSKHAEDYERMIGFRDELNARGGRGWLFSEEGIAQTQPVF